MKKTSRNDAELEDQQTINSIFDTDNLKNSLEESFFREAIERRDVYIICLRRKYQTEEFRVLTELLQDKIFQKINDIIVNRRRDNPNQFIMVLFSESFFAGTDPLDNQIVYRIVERCKALSAQNRVIVQFCLLHKFNISDRPYWLQGKYNPLNSCRKIKKRVVNLKADGGISSFLIANKQHHKRIASYTLSIYGGKIATIYRKSTYCSAAEKWIPLRKGKAIYAYEFGNFKSHTVEQSPISKIFTGKKPFIATRMCSDMNDPHLDASNTKLTILHATDHPNHIFENIVTPTLFVDDNKGFELICPDGSKAGVDKEKDATQIPDNIDGCICRHFNLVNLFEVKKIFVEHVEEILIEAGGFFEPHT